jgi:hypothetical protein
VSQSSKGPYSHDGPRHESVETRRPLRDLSTTACENQSSCLASFRLSKIAEPTTSGSGISPRIFSLNIVAVLEHRGSQTGYESIVGRFYASLYRFALSLTRNEVEVCDLTQQTVFRLAQQSHQIRDTTKIKCWLYTTLRREFLQSLRAQRGYLARRIPSRDSRYSLFL